MPYDISALKARVRRFARLFARFPFGKRRFGAVYLLYIFFFVKLAQSRAVSQSRSYPLWSAVYTPYHLSPGGGEKVLLHVVSTLQRLTDRRVDVVVKHENICKRKACLKQIAQSLQVQGINWSQIRVLTSFQAKKKYLIWFQIGNTLFPELLSRGVLSIYHCQFPFDFNDLYNRVHLLDEALERLASHDSVYVNSQYTAKWYLEAMGIEREAYLSRNGHVPTLPSVVNFSPPFSLATADGMMSRAHSRQSRLRIVLIGRFFEGPQSKHHLDALRAFKLLKVMCSCKPELFLVGHAQPKHERYLSLVKRAVRGEEGVKLLINARDDEIRSLLVESQVIWSLTGFGTPAAKNPADAEHFGISLVEGMSAGLIPIVGAKGGPVEIVENLPFDSTCETIEDIAVKTMKVYQLPHKNLTSLRRLIEARAKELNRFDESFQSIFNILGVQLRPTNVPFWGMMVDRVKYTSLRHGGEVTPGRLSKDNQRENAVVYVETRFDLALRANILNLHSALGSGWTFHIWYGNDNELQLKTALLGLGFVHFHALATLDVEGELNPRAEGAYQMLFKSRRFWEMNGNAEHVLTFQSDAWFHNKGFDAAWLDSDYIGAPWCLEGNSVYLPTSRRPKHDVRMLHTTRQLDRGVRVGNGGVSIRSKHAMLEIIRLYGNESDVQENEDVFAVSAMHDAQYQVASKEEASQFSLECLCLDIDWHQQVINEWTRLSRMPIKKALKEGTKRFSFALHKPAEVFGSLAHISGESKDSIRLFLHHFM